MLLETALKTKCIGIRNDQFKWIERNDINFSKLIRRLVDEEMNRRSLILNTKPSVKDNNLFEFVRGLIIDIVRTNHPELADFNYINYDYVRSVIEVVMPCLDDHYALLTNDEKEFLLKKGQYDQSKDVEKEEMIEFCVNLKSKFHVETMAELNDLFAKGVIDVRYVDHRSRISHVEK